GGARRWLSAGVLSAVTSLASPVAGVFLALAWGASTLSRRLSRSSLLPFACGTAAITPIATAALLFPEGGTFPFRWTSVALVLGACALSLALVPPGLCGLRIRALLYAAPPLRA